MTVEFVLGFAEWYTDNAQMWSSIFILIQYLFLVSMVDVVERR